MFKVLKKKLIFTLVATITPIAVMSISTKTLFILHNTNTINEKTQDYSIKEKNTAEVSADVQNVQENNNQELNSVADAENSSNNDANHQETTSSQLENSNNKDANNQKNINYQQKNPSNYSEINTQETTNFQPENLNSQQVASNQQKNENINTNTVSEAKISTIHYDRTTSIYADDNITLLRIEYYINNKLTYYSVIKQFDATTKSYIEEIYQCNRETNIDPLIRTDVYVNGTLTKSY